MKYLMDTHVWLWGAFSPSKLSSASAAAIQDPASHLSISAVSLWEAFLKYDLGKLDLGTYKPEVLIQTLRALWDVREIPISTAEAISVHHLNAKHHRDPFDRLLIWQAIRGGYTLITKDKQIWKYEDVGLKWLW